MSDESPVLVSDDRVDDAEVSEKVHEPENSESRVDDADPEAEGEEEKKEEDEEDEASTNAQPNAADRAASAAPVAVAAVAKPSASTPASQQPSTPASSSTAQNEEVAKRIAIQNKRREEELARQKVEEEKEFPSGFHYRDDSDELCRFLKPYELSKEYVNLHCSFGYAAQKRYNIHYIDFGVLLFATGNTVQILDLFQDHHQDHRKKTVLLGHGRDSNVGIGAIAVHPSKTFFAVAEKGNNPNIYIYNYPNKEIVRILSKGTEKGYADIQFSHTGTKLVSVGQEPDYLLTVWDWARERVILRTKAFSQEVFHVAFSPVNEGRLLTSGTGHIRFWKMAKTFTGLKLQGAIGKFGNVELSDIAAFVELPDGKVLSGTENGYLLMWDGNFIQFQVCKLAPSSTAASGFERRPCHDGMIEFITLEENNGVREIVTAGADGYVRKWKFDRLEFAEVSEEDPMIALEPIVEIKIGNNVQIRAMLKGDDHWIIQDYNGGLYKLWLNSFEVQKLLDVHSGKINGLATAPTKSHVAVTAGQDHTIRAWDILNGEQLYSRSFNAPATALLWAPTTVDDEHRILLVGFADGVVRVVKRYKDCFKLHHTFKPHTCPVTQLAVSPDGLMLATGAEDGTVFFLSIGFKSKCANLTPLGFVKLNNRPLSMNWHADSSRLLLCAGPDVLEFQKPSVEEYTDPSKMASRDTYEIELPHRVFRAIIRDSRPVDPLEEDDAAEQKLADLLAGGAVPGGPEIAEDGTLRVRDPPKVKPVIGVDLIYDVSAAVYHPTNPDTFFLTLDGGGSREDPHYFPGAPVESLYECSFTLTGDKSTPVAMSAAQGNKFNNEPLHTTHLGRHVGTVNVLSYSLSKKYLLIGTKNGGVQLRALSDLQYFFYNHFHDGSGTSVSHNTATFLQKDRVGLVNAVGTSFDDRFLLSVGNDGNFFAHSIDPVAALAHMDRSIELNVANERKVKEEERQGKIRAKEEAKERTKKEEEERLAKEAAAQKKDAKTREQKDREAREAKEKELRDKEAKEKADRERAERVRVREANKNDIERDDENLEHLSTRIPARSLTKLALPDASSSVEKLEARRVAGGASGIAQEEDALDIIDPKTYSIEEAKLKQEEDDRVAAAEKKKARMRLEIGELRKEFIFLLKKNASLERGQQLPRDAFELDPKLRLELEAEAQAKIDEVRAELAWISEKHSIALQKLRAKFLDHLLVEHIHLKAFHSGITVSCFRTPELPAFLKTAIEGVHRLMESEENLRAQQEQQLALASQHAANASSEDESKDAVSRGGLRGALKARGAGKLTSGSASAGRHRPAGVSEADLRKQARQERAVQLAKLKAAKPDKNVDDPADVQAVQYAEKHMGDYKLKSDPNYIVPEHQRVNAERKRRQMVLLQESVHYIKMALNERFLALRDLKARIIKNIKKDNVRLRELNVKLGLDEVLYEPELDPSEWPEHRELFTREDLKKFETEREKERVRAVNVGSRSIFSSALGSFNDEEDDKKADGAASESKEKESESKKSIPEEGAAAANEEITGVSASQRAGEKEEAARKAAHDARVASSLASSGNATSSAADAVKSSMEQTEDLIQRKLWQHERTTLLDKISYAIWSFDAAIAKLRREKFKLDSDLKTTDLKILTLYQELYLLKDFEENENKLFSKLSKARANKAQVVSEMTDCEKQLSHKLSEIKTWQEKDKQVMTDFNIVVGGEKSEFYTQLLKIFKKKVKRNKKKNARDDLDGEDGDDSDADNLSDSDSDSGDESDSDESDDDSCPLHLDSAIYEKVLELREKRLEQEEILSDFNKNVAELNKTYERLGGRERLIDKELSNTEADIEAFQSEKQRALNLIDVSIPLKLNQMKYLQADGRLPKDISHSLIFTSTGLSKLKNRIVELQQEKFSLSKQFRELKKQHRVLLKELSIKREEIAVEKKKCEDVQMLKFGQIIDLNILEKVGVDEGAAELRSKLKSLEVSSVNKINEWDSKIEEGKNELARITEQNTRWLDKVAKLTKAQYDLEDTLNNTTKNVHVADSSPLDDQSDLERRQLLELVQLQEREIDALKAEIHILRRKGGHVYTPQP